MDDHVFAGCKVALGHWMLFEMKGLALLVEWNRLRVNFSMESVLFGWSRLREMFDNGGLEISLIGISEKGKKTDSGMKDNRLSCVGRMLIYIKD